MRVAIIDYGSGNLRSAAKAFERAARERGLAAIIDVTADPDRVAGADRVVLPGVGAFADCRAGLDAVPGMVEALEQRVRGQGAPFLGICVGMQLMAERGLERVAAHGPATPGLGWLPGDVVRVPTQSKLPQIGWNTLEAVRDHDLLDGIETGPTGLHAYFVHSFHMAPSDSMNGFIVAIADHGAAVTALVARDNMAGTQFHPEKSQTLGLRLIANFLEWQP